MIQIRLMTADENVTAEPANRSRPRQPSLGLPMKHAGK
jgi:hypothetical protein